MLVTTADGVTYDTTNNLMKPIGSDGKAYDSLAAAVNASRVYNAQVKNAGIGIKAKTGTSGGGASPSLDAMTSEFLKTWGGINESVLSSLNDVLKGVDTGYTEGADQLQELINELKTQAQDYETKYGGLEQEAIAAAREDIAARQGLTQQYLDLSTPDYEGVAGRAVTDVRGASARARGASAREMMSLGIDPSSGRFGELSRKSFLEQARNEVIAGNLARREEKDRVANMTATGIQVINPSESSNIAQGIQTTRTGLTGTQAALTEAGINARNIALQTKADIASRIADIGRDYGSAGLTMYGIQAGQNAANAPTGTGINTTAYAPMQGINRLGNYQSAQQLVAPPEEEEEKKKTKTKGGY